jgi:uncharacterized protein YdeI (YjbR/CyaY-like superfamily)
MWPSSTERAKAGAHRLRGDGAARSMTVPGEAGRSRVRTLDVRTRAAWRRWLEAHHASTSAVWLIFHKRHTEISSVSYDDAVEEALCFGWVDSLIKRIDGSRYARKFTPRTENSRWSAINRRRYASLQARGLLAPPGLARAPTDRRGDAPEGSTAWPRDIEARLHAEPRALQFFESLAPSYRRAFVGWIEAAKREETRDKRIREALRLLSAGRKLGMK